MKDDNKVSTIIMNSKDPADDEVNLREMFEKFYFHRKWFVLSILLTLSIAFIYLIMVENKYAVSSTIFVDDKEIGGLSSELGAFEDLGILTNRKKISLINETGILESRTLIENVVKNLDINITYFRKGILKNTELYADNVPFKINFFLNDSALAKVDTVFSLSAVSKSEYILNNSDGDFVSKSLFGKNISTKIGQLNIIPLSLDRVQIGETIIVKIQPVSRVATSYNQKIKVSPEDKNSSLLILTLKDNIKERAIQILDNLVIQYNSDAINYKTKISKNTDKFIDDRIRDISMDLRNVDIGVENFKTKNKLTDLDIQTGLDLNTSSEIQSKILDLNAQINLVDFISEHIENNEESLIPANLGLEDAATNENTSIYNRLLLERNRIIENSSKLNPTVVNLEAQINSLRMSIKQSLTNLRSSLTFSLREARSIESQINAKRNVAPQQEREFQDIKRKQLIIESLYLYLLQKKEENAISLGIPTPNAKIIDKAGGSDIPVSPKRFLVLIISVIIGFIFPAVLITIQQIFDNKFHTREDVEKEVKAPLIGDIPRLNSRNKILIGDHQLNNTIAESFRLLRTNVNFMLSGAEDKAKSIFITSSVSGEGKTFVSMNLATSLALLNKKVLLIEADIRKPNIKDYLEVQSSMGLSHFLMDKNLKISDVVFKNDDYNFDILESGVIPPNPAELLLNGRFEEIMSFAKDNYDYVIVDTAPVNMVTDTLLFGNGADLFIYVVRANYLDKRLLKVPNLLFDEKRLPNMTILVNDINLDKRGYGYGYSIEEETTWYRRIIKNFSF